MPIYMLSLHNTEYSCSYSSIKEYSGQGFYKSVLIHLQEGELRK